MACLVGIALVAAGCSSSGTTSDGSPLGGGPAKGATTPTSPGTTAVPASGDGKLRPYAGSDFYVPPSPLPKGPHGTLIRYQAVPSFSIPGSLAYRILYLSESVQGKPIAVSGTALVPTASPPKGGRDLLTLAHGTTGIADSCAPSRHPGGELLLVGPMVKAGFLVAETDYEGLGTPGRHPYLVGPSEGRSVLDAIIAAGQLPAAHPGKDLAIAGYSQGGHGALWADQLAKAWAPQYTVKGTFAGAPASEVDLILSAAPRLPVAGFAYLLVAGIAAAYPRAKPSLLLTPLGVSKLSLVDHGCVAKVIGAFGGLRSSDLIKPLSTATDPWGPIAKADDAGQVRTDDPTLIIQSRSDDVVPVVFSQILLGRMCHHGQTVERRVVDRGQGHVAAAPGAYAQAWTWLLQRFEPNPPRPTSSCPAKGTPIR